MVIQCKNLRAFDEFTKIVGQENFSDVTPATDAKSQFIQAVQLLWVAIGIIAARSLRRMAT